MSEGPITGGEVSRLRKGTDGVSANGVTANFMVLDRGTFWALPLTCFYVPRSARAYLFPQSVERIYFCSGPISVDPICPQPKAGRLAPQPRKHLHLRPGLLRVVHPLPEPGDGAAGAAACELLSIDLSICIYIYI